MLRGGRGGARILILSDRDCDADYAPIPSLLVTSAVHQHLVRTGQRTQVGLVVETGEAREVHHVALLVGYGAAAVNPYLAFETIDDLVATGAIRGVDAHAAIPNYVKALSKGVLKVMSKMGISTIASYIGAQVFEAFGLGAAAGRRVLRRDAVAARRRRPRRARRTRSAARHARAYPLVPSARAHRRLDVGGEYQWRREGELHLFNPETVFLLQHATRQRRYELFREYTDKVEALNRAGGTLRGLFEFAQRPAAGADRRGRAGQRDRQAVRDRGDVLRFDLGRGARDARDRDEPARRQVQLRRGRRGRRRFTPDANGDLRRSAIKQVASGRFGVTSHYLVNADDMQIKVAQGAKPGEGGQLPGYKVYPWIARTRHSTPGRRA